MTRFASDRYRLKCVIHDERLADIDIQDLWHATLLGAVFGIPKLRKRMQKSRPDPTLAINRVCKILCQRAEKLSKLKSSQSPAPSRLGRAIPSGLISFLAWEMLLRCRHEEIIVPDSLLKLLRLQMEIRSEAVAAEEEVLAMKRMCVCLYAFRNPKASMREIAKYFAVDVSTVSRWNKQNNLVAQGEKLHKLNLQTD